MSKHKNLQTLVQFYSSLLLMPVFANLKPIMSHLSPPSLQGSDVHWPIASLRPPRSNHSARRETSLGASWKLYDIQTVINSLHFCIRLKPRMSFNIDLVLRFSDSDKKLQEKPALVVDVVDGPRCIQNILQALSCKDSSKLARRGCANVEM